MSCNTANGSETNFMSIIDMRVQYVCLNTYTVSICEEYICVWAMENDKNYYLAINKKHINCVRHWHVKYAILNYILFLCIVSMWFSMSIVTILSIFLCSCQYVYHAWAVWLYVSIFYHQICRYYWCFQLKFFAWTNKPICEVLVYRIHGILTHYPATKLLYFDSILNIINHRSN